MKVFEFTGSGIRLVQIQEASGSEPAIYESYKDSERFSFTEHYNRLFEEGMLKDKKYK